jgi:hypothetical protein
MNAIQVLKNRKLSVLGVIMILFSLSGILAENVREQIGLPPILLEVFKFLAVAPKTQEVPGGILWKWPFFATGIIGGILVVFDVGHARRKTVAQVV